MAYTILVPQPGTEPAPSAMTACNPTLQTLEIPHDLTNLIENMTARDGLLYHSLRLCV